MSLDQLKIDWERWKTEMPKYEIAGEAITLDIDSVSRSVGIKCIVTCRTKTPAEFIKKTLRKQDEGYLEDPWKKMTDKVGVRAVVDYESQLDQLKSALEEYPELTVGEVSDTRIGDPKSLEYRGLHMQVCSERYPGIECELQIRTSAQDLWASVVSHKFLYKPRLETTFEVKRSLYRLVSLMELFDGEVGRAMEEIRNSPTYNLVELLDVAEQQLLALVVQPEYDKQFSMDVLAALSKTILESERANYAESLAEWVKNRHGELASVLKEYGPMGGSSNPDYVLFSQPEVIIFLERLDHAKISLEREWRASQLPEELLDATSAIWGNPTS